MTNKLKNKLMMDKENYFTKRAKSFDKFTLLEVVLNINGVDTWYGSYIYDVPFQVGPRFEIPLNEFHKKL